MAIWRGYKEVKEAAGWASLVFAGMGIYRFCKYRVGFDKDAMRRLRNLRKRLEVAADTLHPHWRQLLAIVGVTFTVHVFMSWIFGLEEVQPIIDKARRILFRPVKIQ